MNWKTKAASAIVDAPAFDTLTGDAALAVKLQAARPKLSARDDEFAVSLLKGFDKYTSYTDRQRPYVVQLIERATKPAAPKVFNPQAAFDLRALPVGASGHALYAVEQRRFKVSKPVGGKWEGWVFVNDGSEYGSARRVGSQRPGNTMGEIQGSTHMLQDRADLNAIIANPLEASKQYGRITGTCGICGKTLENPESVAAGIGPVCAGRF